MIRFRLHGVPLCFTGVHMAAHTKNLERRNEVQLQEESLHRDTQKTSLRRNITRYSKQSSPILAAKLFSITSAYSRKREIDCFY